MKKIPTVYKHNKRKLAFSLLFTGTEEKKIPEKDLNLFFILWRETFLLYSFDIKYAS